MVYEEERMSEYVKRDEVLKILYECIEYVEVDESDYALVNYRKAKEQIIQLDGVGDKDAIS